MKWFESSAPRLWKSGLAGSWYPDDPNLLRMEISALLTAQPPAALAGPLSALILPHAGYRYCGAVAAAGIRLLQTRPFRRVVILGPTHRFQLPDAAVVPDAAAFRTVLGDVPLDVEALERLRSPPVFVGPPRSGIGEHSVEIHMPLLQMALEDFSVVPLIVGQLGEDAARQIADGIRPMLDENTLLIVSSDFTHYGLSFGYVPFTDDVLRRLLDLDLGAFDQIRNRDSAGFLKYVQKTGATICGQDAIRVFLHVMGEDQAAELLQYQTSADVTGDDRECVSYLSAAVVGPWPHTAAKPGGGLSEAERAALLRLARDMIGLHLNPLEKILDLPPSPALRRKAGAFVTLHLRGELRGCIGEIEPRRPLAEAVSHLAVSSAFEDPRFPPLRADEWPDVTLEISVLTPLRTVSGWEEIEVGRHGVILHKSGRSAVFLPQVAVEQKWDLETLLAHLSRKAGLLSNAWREGAAFEVFEAEVFGESKYRLPDRVG